MSYLAAHNLPARRRRAREQLHQPIVLSGFLDTAWDFLKDAATGGTASRVEELAREADVAKVRAKLDVVDAEYSKLLRTWKPGQNVYTLDAVRSMMKHIAADVLRPFNEMKISMLKSVSNFAVIDALGDTGSLMESRFARLMNYTFPKLDAADAAGAKTVTLPEFRSLVLSVVAGASGAFKRLAYLEEIKPTILRMGGAIDSVLRFTAWTYRWSSAVVSGVVEGAKAFTNLIPDVGNWMTWLVVGSAGVGAWYLLRKRK